MTSGRGRRDVVTRVPLAPVRRLCLFVSATALVLCAVLMSAVLGGGFAPQIRGGWLIALDAVLLGIFVGAICGDLSGDLIGRRAQRDRERGCVVLGCDRGRVAVVIEDRWLKDNLLRRGLSVVPEGPSGPSRGDADGWPGRGAGRVRRLVSRFHDARWHVATRATLPVGMLSSLSIVLVAMISIEAPSSGAPLDAVVMVLLLAPVGALIAGPLLYAQGYALGTGAVMNRSGRRFDVPGSTIRIEVDDRVIVEHFRENGEVVLPTEAVHIMQSVGERRTHAG